MNGLESEIQRSEYAGLTDVEIAARLNTQAVSYRPVPIAELASLAYGIGLPARLRVALRLPETPIELAAVCEALLDLLKAPFPTVDMLDTAGQPDPASAAMLAALQQAGLLSADEAAALVALARHVEPSRATSLGLAVVTPEDVAAARLAIVAQQTEAVRLADYAAVRERLTHGQHAALVWLQAQQDAGAAAPAWADVLARV